MICFILLSVWNWDVSVSIVTRLQTGWLGHQGSVPDRGRIFCSSFPRHPDQLWGSPRLLCIVYVGHEDGSSSLSGKEMKYIWSCTFTPPYIFMLWCLLKHRDSFIFTVLFFIHFYSCAQARQSYSPIFEWKIQESCFVIMKLILKPDILLLWLKMIFFFAKLRIHVCLFV